MSYSPAMEQLDEMRRGAISQMEMQLRKEFPPGARVSIQPNHMHGPRTGTVVGTRIDDDSLAFLRFRDAHGHEAFACIQTNTIKVIR